MAVLHSDNFNRTDGNLEAPWVPKAANDPRVSTARLRAYSNNSYVTETASEGADRYVQVSSVDVAQNICIFSRCDASTGARYMAVWLTIGSIRLYRYTAWTTGITTIAEVTGQGSPTAGVSGLRLECNGTTVKVIRLDSLVPTTVITSTNRTERTTGRNGLWLVTMGNVTDNYEAGDIAAASSGGTPFGTMNALGRRLIA